MKTKRGSGVWYISSVNTVRKIAAAEASWLTLSSTLLFAELPDLHRSVNGRSHSRVELVKSELPRMQGRNLRTWYWETRADLTLRHQTICLIFSVLWTAMETQTATGLGEKCSWDILFQVISVEKRLMFHRTNCCLGCVGFVYVGRIYQNRGETLLGYRGVFVLVISNTNIGFQKSLTLPLIYTPYLIMTKWKQF